MPGNGADGIDAARRLADRIERDEPYAFPYLGDVYATSLVRRLVFGEGDAHDFSESYDGVYGALAERTAPTPGNHEWRRRGDGYQSYWGAVHGDPVPGWYAFELAGWELLMLNSEAPHDAGSRQVEWLHERVSEGGRGRIAAWHEARFSAASTGGDQPDLAPMWDALEGHATLALAAHDHAMQRLERVGGIAPLVVGSGGHGDHDLERPPTRLAFGDDEHYGALRLELEPGHVRASSSVASNGRVLDSTAHRCRER